MKPAVKRFRAKKGLTQIQVAQRVGITVTSYQRIEYGTQRPSLATAIKIADILDVVDLRELWKDDVAGCAQ